jgi:hypothetical protein
VARRRNRPRRPPTRRRRSPRGPARPVPRPDRGSGDASSDASFGRPPCARTRRQDLNPRRRRAAPPPRPATQRPPHRAPRRAPHVRPGPMTPGRHRAATPLGCCCATPPAAHSPRPRLHPPPESSIRQSLIHRPAKPTNTPRAWAVEPNCSPPEPGPACSVPP